MDLSSYFDSAEQLISIWQDNFFDPSAYPAATKVPLQDIRFLPPTASPRYFCVGKNYRAHREEINFKDERLTDVCSNPAIFLRNPESMVGHECKVLKGSATSCFDYEGELAVVIGKTGKASSSVEAFQLIAGYTCFMDGSARDYQAHSVSAGKNFERSGSVGPSVVLKKSVGNPQKLHLKTLVNGEIVQQAQTSDMIFSVSDIIIYLSKITTLRVGDIIATGTPAGVGMARNPPKWLLPGDNISVEISSVGCLYNVVE